jgi:hypothetical protein
MTEKIEKFKIEKGEISFETDKIRILDNSKKQNLLQLLSSGIWTIYAILSVLRYLKTGDQFLLWTGLFIGMANFVIFILNLIRSNQSEILFDDIKSIKVKRKFGNKYLDIKLKNNRLRRVSGIEDSIKLEEYIKSNINC